VVARAHSKSFHPSPAATTARDKQRTQYQRAHIMLDYGVFIYGQLF